GFAAGVMLAISLFDLMPEALAHGSMTSTVIGFLLGVAIMYFLDRFIPHMHLSSNDNIAERNKQAPAVDNKILRAGYLIFLGIALHNL
ncbi:ZIP family metal transporter, partial [Klebsiella pneumoniae]|uniref:ZIP family metal transporter n=1 Tax=Klebsiella pneumoniae TaxID=573 RepID=UPI00351F80A5